MNFRKCLLTALLAAALLSATPRQSSCAINPAPPGSPVKLIFIHHSSGENWLADDNGGLAAALRDTNYFVSDTNYGWGPGVIGDTTDIGHWFDWFVGPSSATYLAALYAESGQNSGYSRLETDPGGANRIVMFKSCFPNSQLGGNPNDAPTVGDNPLRGQDASSDYMTVANAKGIYNDILVYFAAHTDKLFIVVTAPPLVSGDTDTAHAANARAFNQWLVGDWLAAYPYHNVAVFDFYNVLTSNGGNRNTNDAGAETGNHHRLWSGYVQHLQTVAGNTSAYASSAGDSHATAAGNSKASAEFPALLNVYYHCWNGTGDCPVAGLHADFTADTTSGHAPLTVNFTDLSSGAASGWDWNFGDLGVSTQQSPSHTYTGPGTYTVSLGISDGGSGTSLKTKTSYITVTPDPYTVAPAAGSIGTEIVVTGVDFGTAKGKMRLRYLDSRDRPKRKSLHVLEWTDTRIVGRLDARIEARPSDVMLQPRGPDPVVITGAFTAMAPQVDALSPAAGAPSAQVTVDGSYFGTELGKVRLQHLDGGRVKAQKCDVSSWTMDPASGASSIVFTVDPGLAAGTYDVVISNKIGSALVTAGFTVE